MLKNVLLPAVVLMSCSVISCKKNAVDEFAATDTTGVLKSLADFPVGIGLRHDPFRNNAQYSDLAKAHFNAITFVNELKHNNVVSNEGAFDYSRSDEFLNLAQTAGFKVFGHTLVDWQSTNATFMRSLRHSDGMVNAVPNPGFENGTGASFTNWTTQVGAGATGNFSAELNTPFAGARAMKVNVVTPGPQQYTVQAYSDLFQLNAGNSYTLTFWAKADANGSRMKAVIQNTTYQERTFFLTTNWTQYTWTFPANESHVSLKFHFPFAGVFYFDALEIMKSVSGYMVDPVKVDSAMKRYIVQTMTRYRTSITEWDVVNEPLEDGTGKLRNNPQPGSVTGNHFYHAEFLGKDYIAKAFRYAHEANPSAILYLNENNIETDAVKLDSLIRLVNELKADGVPIHGIGVQMHISIRDDRAQIDRALQRLAATGLRIRISEMDVRLNPWNFFGYRATEADLLAQRDMFRHVVGSYFRHVPAQQRAGITFWELTDKYSWIIVNQGKEDAPTLFDVDYRKKPAYTGVVVGLRRKG